MTANQLAKWAADAAEITLASEGRLVGMIILHAKDKGLMVVPYKDGGLPVQVQQMIIVKVIQEARRTGTFEGAVMVSEAWSSHVPVGKQAIMDVLRPAQDPDRKEIVAVWAYGDDGSKQMITADIIRNDKVSMGERTIVGHGIKSWLDDAFID
jgi:uncharacterized protein YbaA (DUF1428 family)